MAEFDKFKNLFLKLPDLGPSIQGWNRLEGQPRLTDLERSLRAEVRDPLWMLTRQWLMGEFQGEDAGSPVEVMLDTNQEMISSVRDHLNNSLPLDVNTPLQAIVEAENHPETLRSALRIGKYFKTILASNDLMTYFKDYLKKYPFQVDQTITDLTETELQVFESYTDRCFDGNRLLNDIKNGKHKIWIDQLTTVPLPIKPKLKALEPLFLNWYSAAYLQPSNIDTWDKERLEYKFQLSTNGTNPVSFAADQYEGEGIDWYNFDLNAQNLKVLADVHENLSFIPTPISFKGMPLPRYWEFEDHTLEWSHLELGKRDLLQMTVIEFMLTYANDWCVFPYERQTGSICAINHMVVIDTFGNKVLIRPFAKTSDADWKSWAFLSTQNQSRVPSAFSMLSPYNGKPMMSDPVEKVVFIRDEMANMVWAIEDIIPGASGESRNGFEVQIKNESNGNDPDSGLIGYSLGMLPPGNWIPFIPVKIMSNSSEIKLQRGKLPLENFKYKGKILDQPAPYFVYEEEITRAGKQVLRLFKRVRNHEGKIFLWLGREIHSGRGEGSSGIRWDVIENR